MDIIWIENEDINNHNSPQYTSTVLKRTYTTAGQQEENIMIHDKEGQVAADPEVLKEKENVIFTVPKTF